jgi:hypothetical protein
VALYEAEWQGAKTEVEAYAAHVKAVEAYVQAQKAGVEAYGEQVRAQESIVRAWSAEWDGYAKKLEAERLKLGRFEVESRIFGERVRGYSAEIQAGATRAESQVSANQLQLERSRVDVQRYQADASLETTKLGAYDSYHRALGMRAEVAATDVQRYNAQVGHENARASAWAAGYDGYAKLGAGEATKAQALQAYAGAYQAQVAAYAAGISGEAQRVNALSDIEKLKQDVQKVDLQRFVAEWQAITSRLNALSSVYGADAQVYSSAIQGETASVNAQAQAYTVGMQEAELRLKASTEYEQLRATFYDATARAETALIGSKGSVLAQVGSAAFAAANVTMSTSHGDSRTCSTNYSYDMTGS